MMTFRLLTLFLLPVSSFAESLSFVSGGTFSGEVLSITEGEGVAVQTARSPEPLYFHFDAIRNLALSPSDRAEASPFQTERLVLSNGDIIPGTLVALQEESMTFQGPLKQEDSDMTIPRDQIKTLRFGIRPQRMIYQGPAPLENWSGTGKENWTMSEKDAQSLLLLAPGEISQDLGLARQFILQFDLHWQEEPSVRLYFCDEGKGASKSDRYYIDINHGGIQIKRERSESPHWISLINLGNSIEAFDDNHLSVEIRGNRLLGTLDLYLDGKLVRQLKDQSDRTIGTGVIIVRNKSEQSVTQLSNLKAFSWDAVSQLQLLEQGGDDTGDSLIDAEGKRMTGKLTKLVVPQAKAPEEPEKTEEPGEAEEIIGDEPEGAAEANKPTEESPAREKETEEEGNLTEKTPEKEKVEKRKPQPNAEEESLPPPYFLFQSPFADEPIQIPAEQTRIIHFKEKKVADVDNLPEATRFQLLLADDGLLSANDLTMSGDLISFSHPLLGRLTLPREAVHTIRNFPPLNDENE